MQIPIWQRARGPGYAIKGPQTQELFRIIRETNKPATCLGVQLIAESVEFVKR